MLYHVKTHAGIITYDRNDCDQRSIKAYFLDALGIEKPAPVNVVKGYPFRNIYLTHGSVENGLFVAIRSK